MKKFLVAFLFVAAFAGILIAGPQNFTVGTSSVKILAERDIQAATAWATNVSYVNGQIVQANRKYWMCITNGTSATSGTGPTGSGDQSDGVLTWRQVPKGARNGMVICNDSATVLYISFGAAAEANKGIRLNANGGSWSSNPEDKLQAAIYAIGTNAGNNVTIMEW